MRPLAIRLLVLMVMVGFLMVSGMTTSKAGACNGQCYQSCYNEYTECINFYGSGGFYFCCAEFNACHEACGTCPQCFLPEDPPSK